MANSNSIAIVGMSGRFPGARSLDDFWRNLRDGVESITDRSNKELLAAGVSPEELQNPDYVKRASILDDVPLFDAAFFGLSPRDAAIMDPQHRHFLEVAWEALESAGHVPQNFNGSIGVFAGSGMNTYLIHNLLRNRQLLNEAGLFQLKQTGNDKDVLATRLSYQFDLRGPSINVQTACSTSLVAVHLACQSLLNFECDLALAGGVTIEVPHGRGYLYREGEILARDGHCRPFDAQSSGTVFASGAGVVVLRRLEDALADGDPIRAVILGSAINNDGARKVGYLAPSVEGQAEVIAEAISFANLKSSDISYVETHGTGTRVGDPIEVRALTQAFRQSSASGRPCALGSLKSNLGHLDSAAGIAGLIKTVLALEHQQIPPTLHYTTLNAHINLAASPFYIADRLLDWKSDGEPRRAGVTSLGIGGTNAHIILEQAPLRNSAPVAARYEILLASAKTATAADQNLLNLRNHLQAYPSTNLSNAAFTMQAGRKAFAHRRALVLASDDSRPDDLLAATAIAGHAQQQAPEVIFLFPGQGSQYVQMGRELYDQEPIFRAMLDQCDALLQPLIGTSLISALYPDAQNEALATDALRQTWLTQPALFAVEYALAKWWMAHGVQPSALAGHSVGEYVAACLAGVFTLPDALDLMATRGRLIHALPAGAMLAVPLAANEFEIAPELSIAALNAPRMCVVSGPGVVLEQLQHELALRQIVCKMLATSHAFHSSMLDPILNTFEQKLSSIKMQPPRLPFASNVSGTWITTEQAQSPAYWTEHLRSTVRFADNLHTITSNRSAVLLECGPGSTLATLAILQLPEPCKTCATLPHPSHKTAALRTALTSMAQLWSQGVAVDFTPRQQSRNLSRIPLPHYAFEHQHFWIDADPEPWMQRSQNMAATAAATQSNHALQFYRRNWVSVPATEPGQQSTPSSKNATTWILIGDASDVADQLHRTLIERGLFVVRARSGKGFAQSSTQEFVLRTDARNDYDQLFSALDKRAQRSLNIVFFVATAEPVKTAPRANLTTDFFYTPLALAQALQSLTPDELRLTFITHGIENTAHASTQTSMQALLYGPARVLPQELPQAVVRTLDIDQDSQPVSAIANAILALPDKAIAPASFVQRNGQLTQMRLEVFQPQLSTNTNRLRNNGVYLIMGGLGELALATAQFLADKFHASLILAGRSTVQPEPFWNDLAHDTTLSYHQRQLYSQLAAIRASAAAVHVLKADVAIASDVDACVQYALANFTSLDGVFHTAGLLEDQLLALKTRESAERVLAPKIAGSIALEQALKNHPETFLALYSSISSIHPPAGQVDYAAANAFLDAFASTRPNTFAINWGPWKTIGMAARARAPHEWLNQERLNTPQACVFSGDFSQATHWVLAEHRLQDGAALIPGTAYLELAAAAFQHVRPHTAFAFQNVFFLQPFLVEHAEHRELRVQVELDQNSPATAKSYRFRILGFGQRWMEHATGELLPMATIAPAPVPLNTLLDRCSVRHIHFDSAHRTQQERQFHFGPRWQSLQTLHIGHNEAVAELILDDQYLNDLTGLSLHPALLDMATGAAFYLTANYSHSDGVFLPVGYKRLRFYKPLPAHFFSHIRINSNSQTQNPIESFDLALIGYNGDLLAEIEGYTARRIAHVEAGQLLNAALHSVRPQEEVAPLALPESDAIETSEGLQALEQILNSDGPRVVAVLKPSTLIDGLTFFNQDAANRLSADSPQDHANTADVAATLSAWWQQMLGVTNVGLDDDFFLLGGHSLVGVRLFARIKQTWQIDLDLAVLFEARTVRQMAAKINSALLPAQPDNAKRAWSALVPVQPNGSRVPLFCVHAVGGDVVFYEQLARALGPDQPFYAFQSPLVADPARRDLTIEDMARLYIREMRELLPNGPYLLGGASYGGFVIFEMARQLNAEGITPALVAMFDVTVPHSAHVLTHHEKFGRFTASLKLEGLTYLKRKAEEKSTYYRDKFLEAIYYPLHNRWAQARGRSLNAIERFHLISEGHWVALSRYQFTPFDGAITLVRATDRGPEVLGKIEDPLLGWGALAKGGVEVIHVPTIHMHMLFEPYVGEFARTLSTVMRNALANSKPQL